MIPAMICFAQQVHSCLPFEKPWLVIVVPQPLRGLGGGGGGMCSCVSGWAHLEASSRDLPVLLDRPLLSVDSDFGLSSKVQAQAGRSLRMSRNWGRLSFPRWSSE